MDTQIKDMCDDYASTVDTSRPFSSVKEAVAIFGERLLTREIYSPNPPHIRPVAVKTCSYKLSPSPSLTINNTDEDGMLLDTPPVAFKSCSYKLSPSSSLHKNSSSEDGVVLDTLKKLEAELRETKEELKLLKERESDTEIALASLNAELHKNMSKMAEAEAAAAAKNAAARENNPTLAQVLRVSGYQEKYDYFGNKRERKFLMKKKPIIPLVGDLFSKRKSPSNATALHSSSLFASSELYFN